MQSFRSFAITLLNEFKNYDEKNEPEEKRCLYFRSNDDARHAFVPDLGRRTFGTGL